MRRKTLVPVWLAIFGIVAIFGPLSILSIRAYNQRAAVHNLANFDSVTIAIFFDNEYLQLPLQSSDEPNHFTQSITALELDLTWGDAGPLIPHLRRLPALKKIYISYQGDVEPIKRQRDELRSAFPNIEFELQHYMVRTPIVG